MPLKFYFSGLFLMEIFFFQFDPMVFFLSKKGVWKLLFLWFWSYTKRNTYFDVPNMCLFINNVYVDCNLLFHLKQGRQWYFPYWQLRIQSWDFHRQLFHLKQTIFLLFVELYFRMWSCASTITTNFYNLNFLYLNYLWYPFFVD